MSTLIKLNNFEKIYNKTYNKVLRYIICKCQNLEDVNEIKDIHNDVKEIIKESHQLTKKDVTYNIYRRLWQSILRFFAPFF